MSRIITGREEITAWPWLSSQLTSARTWGPFIVESSNQQLEYLRQHYDELVDHTELLVEQSALLIRIARHTQLFYVLAWIYVGLTALVIVVVMVAAAASPY